MNNCIFFALLINHNIYSDHFSPIASIVSLLDGRVHTIANFVGAEASMPCEVYLSGCGKIYFITWTKNISNEWQRVYLYSESYQKVLGDFESYEAGRVTFHAENITATGVTYLKIRSITVADEGTYKVSRRMIYVSLT